MKAQEGDLLSSRPTDYMPYISRIKKNHKAAHFPLLLLTHQLSMIHPGGAAVKTQPFIQLFPYVSYLFKIKTNTSCMPAPPTLIISRILGCRRWKDHDSRAGGWARRWVVLPLGAEVCSKPARMLKIHSLPRVLHNGPCLFIIGGCGLRIFSLQILFGTEMHIVGV